MHWERVVVGIFKFEAFIRLPNGNVLFKIEFKSQCSGLKILIWAPSAYSLYNSDSEITKRVSVEEKRSKDWTLGKHSNIQISR